MPVVDLQEARDVDRAIGQLLVASATQRKMALREVFVGRLDFVAPDIDAIIPLHGTDLPPSASIVATRDRIIVVLVQLPAGARLTSKSLTLAIKEIRRSLTDDVFLAATNEAGTEWQFVYPTYGGGREVLRRMVIYRGQPYRTVAQQLAGIYLEAQRSDLHNALERAYDVEAVTKFFFTEYKRVFDAVMGLVVGLPHDEERKLYCQTLFNRLMFLYFLQRKGWLIYNGDQDYLNALWQGYTVTPVAERRENFYASRLKLLFFTALSNEHSQDCADSRVGTVPFLNGGLFSLNELDERVGVTVPDEAIQMILIELFARFNFTITESTPYDVEVAVDPEMLGKVFERMVTGRHETGSYYTPRPIVSFMCREALKGYLTAHIEELTPEAVVAFVDEYDVSGIPFTLAGKVLNALETITVVDPACGSGAYLLGMLHELVELQRLLWSSNLITGSKEMYELKLNVIQRNVYGVDIDRFAVNIAMLRLWLSLVVEYEGSGNPPALPNLDYKIACGDSLTAPDPQGTGITDLIRHTATEMATRIAVLKAEFLRATGEEKLHVQQDIKERQAELSAMLSHSDLPTDTLDWRVQFAEVFRHGGFDIVLANPPYLRMELFRDKKPVLRRNFPEVHAERADLYVYFFERANQLLRPKGIATFISSNKWLRAGYGVGLRNYLETKAHMRLVLDFGELPVFQSATTYPAIFVWQKSTRKGTTCFANVTNLDALYAEGIPHFIARVGQDLSATHFQGPNWSLVSTDDGAIRRKMEAAGTPLVQYVGGKIGWGIKTGLNDAFWIDASTRSLLIASDHQSVEVIKPLLVGNDIRRYEAHNRDRYILYLPHDIDIGRYPAVREYLRPFRANLEARATKQEWYELQQPQEAYVDFFESPKIVFPDIGQAKVFSRSEALLR